MRTDGLWASLTCETRDEHWSVGMEAFAVGYDDPVDALGSERGDRVALGFDLEWEREGGLWRVTGEVLVGDARVALDTFGAVGAADEVAVAGRLGGEPFVTNDFIPVVAPDGLLAGGVASIGDHRVQLEPRWAAPVKFASVPRALCRFDGGVAWAGST